MKKILILFAWILISCNMNKKASEKKNNLPQAEKAQTAEGASTEFLFKKLNQGIEFYAIGNEPSWSLDMDFEGGYVFRTMDFSFNCPPGEGHRSEEDDVTMFRAKTQSGEIMITLFKTPCTDNMSGEKFSHKVKAEVKKTGAADFSTYEGCGRYVFDQRIHDIWVLEKMNGKTIAGKNEAGQIPQVEFNTSENKILGNTGCNNFFGAARCYGNKVELGNIGSTKKYCEGAAYESEFLKSMEPGRYFYLIQDGRLTLKREDKEIFVFKKVD